MKYLILMVIMTTALFSKTYKIDETCDTLLNRAVWSLNKSRKVKSEQSHIKYTSNASANFDAFRECANIAENFGLKEARKILEKIK